MSKFNTPGVGGITSDGTNVTAVSFPATQSASAGANVLDDYEEGDWTPTDGSGASLSLTTGACQYTKVGQLVHAFFDIVYPSNSDGSESQINSLPFTAQNSNAFPVTVGYSNYGAIAGIMNNSGASFRWYTPTGGRPTNANLSVKTLRGCAIYRATA